MPVQGAALVLSKCSLFKDFSDTGLAIVASIAVDRSLPSGSPLFVEGMESDAFFIVKSGSVKVAMKGEHEEQIIGFLGEGDALGQLSLLGTTGLRLVTAVAEGPTELVEIRQRDFVRLQTQKPQACLKLMMAVAGQIGRFLGENREFLKAAAAGHRQGTTSLNH
jgi:CRP/FNR family cyclic AMP-dependent transcriptional regulator